MKSRATSRVLNDSEIQSSKRRVFTQYRHGFNVFATARQSETKESVGEQKGLIPEVLKFVQGKIRVKE
jgi:hypothetical protein